MKNKAVVSKEILFFLSNVFDAASGALLIKAGFGNTSMGAFPLVLNEIFPNFSIGQMNFIVQVIVLIILMIIVRKVSSYYLMSFIAAFIYDGMLDIFVVLFRNLPYTENLRILYFVLAVMGVAFGCGGYQYCDLPLMPFDIVVHDISKKFDKKHADIKLLIDCLFLLSTIALSLIIFHRITNIGLATIIISFTNGTLIAFYDTAVFERFRYKMSTKVGQVLENLKAF